MRSSLLALALALGLLVASCDSAGCPHMDCQHVLTVSIFRSGLVAFQDGYYEFELELEGHEWLVPCSVGDDGAKVECEPVLGSDVGMSAEYDSGVNGFIFFASQIPYVEGEDDPGNLELRLWRDGALVVEEELELAWGVGFTGRCSPCRSASGGTIIGGG